MGGSFPRKQGRFFPCSGGYCIPVFLFFPMLIHFPLSKGGTVDQNIDNLHRQDSLEYSQGSLERSLCSMVFQNNSGCIPNYIWLYSRLRLATLRPLLTPTVGTPDPCILSLMKFDFYVMLKITFGLLFQHTRSFFICMVH